jgi:hypothetical protein
MRSKRFLSILAGLGLTAAITCPSMVMAVQPLASGTITTTATGATNTYALTLSDAAGSPASIASVWAAWVPGKFFFAATPSSVSSPAGWSGTTANGGIQWTADSSSFDIPAGSTLSGFGFESTESPSLIDGDSPSFPGTPTMTSVAYDGGILLDTGTTFAFTPTAVPEPTTLALLAPAAFVMLRRSRRNG